MLSPEMEKQVIDQLLEGGWSVIGNHCYHEILIYPAHITIMEAIDVHNDIVDYFEYQNKIHEYVPITIN